MTTRKKKRQQDGGGGAGGGGFLKKVSSLFSLDTVQYTVVASASSFVIRCSLLSFLYIRICVCVC